MRLIPKIFSLLALLVVVVASVHAQERTLAERLGYPRDAKLITKTSYKPGTERDVYVYFDNDIKVHAPFDAINLAKLVKGTQ